MTYKQKGVCPEEGKDAFVFYFEKKRHAVVHNFNHINLTAELLAILN